MCSWIGQYHHQKANCNAVPPTFARPSSLRCPHTSEEANNRAENATSDILFLTASKNAEEDEICEGLDLVGGMSEGKMAATIAFYFEVLHPWDCLELLVCSYNAVFFFLERLQAAK